MPAYGLHLHTRLIQHMRYVLAGLLISLPEHKHNEKCVPNVKITRACYGLWEGFCNAS